MFKLVVLSALLAIAAAGVISPVAYTVAETPVIAKVGAVVENVPTAVSHQSSTVVHSRAAISTPIVTPVVQKTVVASHAPIAYTAPLAYSAHPVVYQKGVIAGTGPIAYAAPAVKYVSSPLVYSAPTVVKAW